MHTGALQYRSKKFGHTHLFDEDGTSIASESESLNRSLRRFFLINERENLIYSFAFKRPNILFKLKFLKI